MLDRLIRGWQRGPYSHVEAILVDHGDGTAECASSVPGEGVRIATIDLPSSDWDVVETNVDASDVRSWFESHAGASYDYLGVLGFVLRPVVGEKRCYFCSEAIAASLGISHAWRVDPNLLADVLATALVTNVSRATLEA